MSKISKYDVLSLLAKKMPFYGATQWLKTENEGLGGEIPSDLLKDDKPEIVYRQLKKEINSRKKK
jgi:hypothetical protein